MTTHPEPTLADQPHQVRITTDGVTAKITLDGQDISRLLQGYTLEQHVRQPPMLVLYASPHRDGVVFDGLAHVAVTDPQQDVSEQIAAYLANINPAALEQAALERDDLTDERYGLTAAMLATLADWVRGDT